jgi:hypothetical protein
MAPVTKRTLSVDLPDALVRRAARHVGRDGGFSAVLEQALIQWLDERDETAAPPSAFDTASATQREIV